MSGPLIHDQENDYTLKPDETSCWITVNNLSVYVIRTDEGVVVDIYPYGRETETEPVASTYAFFNKGELDDT